MIKAFARYFVFLLVAAGLVYGGYRMLKQATPKPTPTETSESEHSDSVILSGAKVEASGIELAKASSGVLRNSMFLNGIVQPNQESLVQVTPRFPESSVTRVSASAIRSRRATSSRSSRAIKA